MICPNCGSHISDEADICPACRADVAQHLNRKDAAFSSSSRRYCPNCGALLSNTDTSCPKCGTPCENVPFRKPVERIPDPVPKEERDPIPEGTLPADRLYEERVGWQDVGTGKVVITLVVAALLLIIVITFLTTHLSASRTSDPVPIVEPQPLVIDKLKGQDSSEDSAANNPS